MEGVPSDIVELIIAVDLNPTDPEEPINVKDVNVRKDGEGPSEGDDWQKLTMQLLMGDPAAGVTSESISYDEAVDAVARVLGKDEKPTEGGEDPFSKAKSLSEPQGEPGGQYGSPYEGKGSMKTALNRALGREDKDEEEEL